MGFGPTLLPMEMCCAAGLNGFLWNPLWLRVSGWVSSACVSCVPKANKRRHHRQRTIADDAHVQQMRLPGAPQLSEEVNQMVA